MLPYLFPSIVVSTFSLSLLGPKFCHASPVTPSVSNLTELPPHSFVQRITQQQLSCCDVLHFFLPEKVSFAPATNYTSSLLSYWSQQEQQISPACIVIPRMARDVQIAIFVLNVAGKILEDDGCKFAIRSGGQVFGTHAAT